ncbi:MULTISPECIES: DUF2252 domain-containing protein [unclassified Streptomyces]|uniref:DUF2252 domain-containing protein n=1 Tax=unclassified Streptomyces TaxID=2593676 RepID=UPI00225538BF|nr:MULTISPECIES: DUF2252 domain-containing protein [unclassified Streptomyces]WSP56205.1 DUF2252 domain-containing protein [Streptomyces sp. NBC_01241]WSU23096.1 DUF2252 domain-containing protein [Streptomyces sp. NBC_01108]MCX4787915.1 DUF2252 domain-containing protein [Streptomyces sp. NBC_01221]MCX4796322.1 DUF2252 domain-containing protein [Streptomyces sp. NBC_01242]WSJ37564.1 DUF2252 domain-containing protein [Streptomyces sp. NBC_01321]
MGKIEATVPVQRAVQGNPRIPVVPGFARREDGVAAVGGSAPQSPRRVGKALRERVSRASHSSLDLPARRPDAVQAVEESNRGRVPGLTPIRVGRMAATPFAFLRGSAGLMAHDLAGTPVSGVGAQLCGDAHAANFGLYGDARGSLVIDLNDFDETMFGPWEWDLKRLATSLVLAGREAGADEDTCHQGAYDTVGAYRRTMRLLAKMPALDAWNAIADEELVSHTDARDLLGTLERVSEKARNNTSARFAAKSTEGSGGGGRRFIDAPPVLRRVPDDEAAAVAAGLGDYLGTISEDRVPLLARYAIHDVAFRVVGTGSVGTRSYVVLLLDHRGESLVLQVKEARPSVLSPYLPAAGFDVPGVAHEGRRVVLGQKRMQVVSDILLGWATVEGRPFQVRQFRNRKGSVDPAALAADQVDDYGRMTGALLARAHAHSADPRLIAGYCGKNEELDEAVAAFAVTYADRTEADHTELVRAIGAGRIAAEPGV